MKIKEKKLSVHPTMCYNIQPVRTALNHTALSEIGHVGSTWIHVAARGHSWQHVFYSTLTRDRSDFEVLSITALVILKNIMYFRSSVKKLKLVGTNRKLLISSIQTADI